jgi:hypothetical protein
VRVDEARADDPAAGVDHVGRVLLDPGGAGFDGDDALAVDHHRPGIGCSSGAVDNQRVDDLHPAECTDQQRRGNRLGA